MATLALPTRCFSSYTHPSASIAGQTGQLAHPAAQILALWYNLAGAGWAGSPPPPTHSTRAARALGAMVLAKTRSTTMVRSRGGGRILPARLLCWILGHNSACMHALLPSRCLHIQRHMSGSLPTPHSPACCSHARPPALCPPSSLSHTPTRSPAPWQHAAAILFAALLLLASSQAQSCREQGCSDSWSVRIDAALARAAIEYNRATVLLTLSEGRQEGAFDADIAANTAPLQLAREGVCRVLGCSG